MALSVEFIYLTTRVAREWIKERGITHFTQRTMRNKELAYDGDQIGLCRRVHQ